MEATAGSYGHRAGGEPVSRSGSGTLAIVVPTFNRQEAAARLAGQLASWTATPDGGVCAVFYDDGSSDETYAALQPHLSDELRIVRNDTNQGYARTLVRALSECDAEWAMMVADDDVLVPVPGQPEALTTWLRREQPDFVCTQWLRSDGRLYRGRVSSGRISPRNLREVASHAPGLIYRSSSARQALPTLGRELDRGSDAASVYPQVVLAAHILASGGKALYWPSAVVREGSGLPSGIRDLRGRRYASRGSRVAQGVAFDSLFRRMERNAPDTRYKAACRTFRRDNEVRLGKALHRFLRAQFPRDMWGREMYGVVARSALRLLSRNLRRKGLPLGRSR